MALDWQAQPLALCDNPPRFVRPDIAVPFRCALGPYGRVYIFLLAEEETLR